MKHFYSRTEIFITSRSILSLVSLHPTGLGVHYVIIWGFQFTVLRNQRLRRSLVESTAFIKWTT